MNKSYKIDKVASASLNGNFIIWDIGQNGLSGSKYQYFKAIFNKILIKGQPFETFSNTAVNKVNWNPFKKDNLVTGSQDGLIKLWVFSINFSFS